MAASGGCNLEESDATNPASQPGTGSTTKPAVRRKAATPAFVVEPLWS
jgi:hypothetical protein